MRNELYKLSIEVYQYLEKCFLYVKPIFVFIISGASYILFPDQAYIPPTIGLLIALILDVVSKYYAIGKKNGGLWNAIKTRKISSESMWNGTKKKLVSIIVVMIVCGLLLRFTPFLPQIAITITTVAYAFMFYREVQSFLENMIDAGHTDLMWFLNLIKRKKKEILDTEEVEMKPTDTEEESNNTPTI